MTEKVMKMEMHKRLKELRIQNGYTQKQVANYLEMDQSYLSKIENGERNVNDVGFDRLCLLYDCSSDYLLGESDEYEVPKMSFRADEKADLFAIAKMNQVMGHLKVLRDLEGEMK